jgi:hypothetical protein
MTTLKSKTIESGKIVFEHMGETLAADYEINRVTHTAHNETADYLDVISVDGKSNDWVDEHFDHDLIGDVDRALTAAKRDSHADMMAGDSNHSK